MDDAITKNTGDSNAAQDQAMALALNIQAGYVPAVLGATCTRKYVGDEYLRIMLDAGGLDQIEIAQGHAKYEEAPSDLGRKIIEMSKLGRLDIDLGGPCCDLAWAMKSGAHNHNIFVWALLGGTWNAQDKHIDVSIKEHHRKNMKASADFVRRTLGNRLVEIPDPDYQKLLHKKNLPAQFRDTAKLIHDWRKYSMWDAVNTQWVITENIQGQGERFDTEGLRIADVLATAERLGIKSIGELFSKAEHGFQINQASL